VNSQKIAKFILAKFCIALILFLPFLVEADDKKVDLDYQVYNFSLYGDSISEFSIKKINASEINQYLLPEVSKNIQTTGSKDLFLLSAPTQNTAGYSFEITRRKKKLNVCLRMPSKEQNVSMVVTNPSAILITQKDLKVFLSIDYCPH
jgi:hypothetical protein